MKIINISEKIEKIISKHNLEDRSLFLENEYAITNSKKLRETIAKMEDDSRVLKIGIVGRVKAGKSSLLNALIFDGEEVLPKAATPMTAALTVLEYGDETKAEVEFFTKDEIGDMKKGYEEYKKQLTTLTDTKLEELSKIKLKELSKNNEPKKIKNLSKEQKEEIRKKAEKKASQEMKNNDSLFSLYDQYSKIKESKISLDKLQDKNIITASSTTELNKELQEFVGVNGKYMPFTKSATLKLKQKTLKDIQIIDTPGINDPVTSRENRTRELLKDCDVVLVVSPSGQFLSIEDIDLMDRITSKEGIKEIYLVVSQTDNQLFAGEKNKGNGILSTVLRNIETTLTHQQQKILKKQKENHPEIGNTFDKLIKNKVILSSGISYSMLKSFDSKEKWDENAVTVWENLTIHYKDFFDNDKTALSNLNKLANIDSIKNIIEEVKTKKDIILQQRKDEFIEAKQQALFDYKEALENDIKESIKKIQESDIDEIREQKETMSNIKERASDAVNENYKDCVDGLKNDFPEILNKKCNSFFRQSQSDVSSSEGSESESYEKGCWFWKKTIKETFKVVKAGYVRNSLEELTYTVETTIDIDSKKYICDWKKDLTKQILPVLRKEAGDDALDAILIGKVVRKIINAVKEPEISYTGDFPEDLKKSGTLQRSQAELFIESVSNYMSSFKKRAREDIKKYICNLINILEKQNIAKDIFSKYSEDIHKLEKEIADKEQSIKKHENILDELQAVKND